MSDSEFTQLADLEPTKIDDGSTITVGLMMMPEPSIPTVVVRITPKTGKEKVYSYTITGVGGNFEFVRFKVGKKKRLAFPFELESFEVNTGLLKTKFRRKS